MSHYETTKARIFQWIGIVLVVAVFAGAYWYFQVYGSTVNAPQNDSLTSGLVGLWSFNGDDISGTTAYDRSGSGNNGTLTGGPTVTQGKVGQALNFDGTDDYVVVPNNGAFNIGTGASFSVWVKQTTVSGGIIFRKWVSGGEDKALSIASGGAINFYLHNTFGGSVLATSSGVVTANTWVHIVGRYDGSTAKIFVNGVEVASKSASGDVADANGTFNIGRSSDGTGYFSGSIDEVRIYNRALSATEIQSLYALGQSDKVNSSVSQPQGTGRLDSGLAGYWKLDENTGTSAGDASTNGNTGTLTNGPTWTTGQIGSAVTFDGTNDYADSIPLGGLPSATGTISIAFWGKTIAISSDSVIQAATDDSNNRLNIHFPWADNNIYWDFGDIASGGRLTAAWDASWTNQWAHWSFISENGVGQKIYRNGVLLASDSDTSTFTKGTKVLQFGRHTAPSYWNGSLDEVRIYSRALSADEVSQLYRLTTPTGVDTGLKGYWSFNGKDMNGTSAFDRSGSGNTGTLTNGPTKIPGKVGQALNFDGSDDFIAAGDVLDSVFNGTGNKFSMTAWVRSDVNADNDFIVSKYSNATAGEAEFFFRVASQKLHFLFYGVTSGASYRGFTSNTVMQAGQWYYVAMTYDGALSYNNRVKLYVNGIDDGAAVTISAGSPDSIPSSATPLRLGGSTGTGGPNYGWDGAIDEVRVYNRALSASEIQSLYASGQSDKVNSSVSQSQGTGRLDSGLAGYWKLDENTGTSAGDSSTNGNTGTLTNGPTWTTGQIGSAVDFDGTNDYVAMGTSDNLNTPSAVTVSVWIKSNYNFGSVLNVMFGAVSRMQDVSTFNGYEIGVGGNYISAGNKAYFHAGGTYTTNALIGTSTVNDGAWHHLVGKYDGTKSYIYVDGILENSGNKTNNLNRLGENFDVGNNYDRTRTFPGSIDEARIYNRALSADEVSQLYRLTAPTGVDTGLKGYWSFNGQDMSGTTAYDRSGAGNTGTLTNGPTKVPGKLGQALRFDGTDDYVSISDTASLTLGKVDFSMSTWLKYTSTAFATVLAWRHIAVPDNAKIQGLLTINRATGASGNIEAETWAWSDTATRVHSGAMNDGQWHFASVTYTASDNNLRLYVDGALVDTKGQGATSPTVSSNFGVVIGNNANFTQTFPGSLDEVRVYNRALSADEIKALYNASR